MSDTESSQSNDPPLASLAYRAERQSPWRPIVRVTAGLSMLIGLLELLSVGTSFVADRLDRLGYVGVDDNLGGALWLVASIALMVCGAGAWSGKRWARKGLIYTAAFIMFAFLVAFLLTMLEYFSIATTPPTPLPIRILYAMSGVLGTISKSILPAVLIWIMTREEVKEMF